MNDYLVADISLSDWKIFDAKKLTSGLGPEHRPAPAA